nr:DUF6417 family protein [Streptomyces sp. TSRI0107]
MESRAYGLWLHAVTRSAAEANRFGREYGIVYRPAPTRHARPPKTSAEALRLRSLRLPRWV